MENRITLAGADHRISYNFEAVEAIQNDLNVDSLNDVYLTISRAMSDGEQSGITTKDIANVMRVAKTVIFHGIRGACLEDDTIMPFKTPAHVGAHIKSIKEATQQLVLFRVSLDDIFRADPDDEGNAQGRTATPAK